MSPRLFLCLAPFIALTACGDSDLLTVRGEAAVELSPMRTERFPFAQNVTLEEDYEVARGADLFAGRCTLQQGAVDLEIARPGSTGGMTSFAVAIDGVGAGSVAAVIDGTEWTGSSGSGTCSTRTTYIEPDDELVGIEVDCTLADAAGGSAQATAELFFEECEDVAGE